jgi:hypothetical protein
MFATPGTFSGKTKETEMSKQKSRREILQKTAYVVPTVMTLAVKPSFASTGSGQYDGQNAPERRGGGWEDHSNSRYEREEKKAKNEKKEKKH